VRNKLYFSKSPADPAHGVIDLQHCLTVKSAEEKTGKKHAFEVATPDQVFFMFADTDEEKDDWIGCVQLSTPPQVSPGQGARTLGRPSHLTPFPISRPRARRKIGKAIVDHSRSQIREEEEEDDDDDDEEDR
jgi:hypothetical protein